MSVRQYKDYSEWMKSRDLSEQKKYWIEQFAEEVPILNIPLDFPRPKVKSFKGNTVKCKIEKIMRKKIQKLARETGSTEYMIFLAAAMILLGKYSRQEDIVIGSPISARIYKDMENMLGMFANTLVFRGKPCNDKSFRSFLEEIKQICLSAYDNQEYPFEELVESLDICRDPSRNPLFDVFLSFEDKTLEEICFDGLEMEIMESQICTAKFDLSFYIINEVDHYDMTIEYCTDLFKQDSIERLQSHYIKTLKEIANNKNILIGDIEIALQSEKNIINSQFNNTDKSYAIDKNVIALFENQVKKDPNKIAVISDRETISYDELNKRANSLAIKLKELGIEREVFVVIIAKRSVEMIVGIYATLKAGGVVVPVAPSYPHSRIEYIINDCMPKAILKYSIDISLESVIEEKFCKVLDLADKENYVLDSNNVECSSTLEDAAYCIYTSGTSGKPKGVININKGLLNRVLWMQDRYPITDADVILQKTSYTFDVSVWEIVWWGIVGATVSLLPDGTEKDPSEICKTIEDTEVTVIHFVPSMLNVFLSYIENFGKQEVLSHMKYIFSSGEVLNPSSANRTMDNLWRINSHARLINLYGPTEASIDVTHFECKKHTNLIPIGKPISNIKIYILDYKGRMTGIGVQGEICITGVGLAREYLNKEQLTKEKFRDNPFGQGKIYHTGDYGRWLPDGNIEYLGRADDQVKIRGFRIELGEIEAHIRNIKNVIDCAVIVKEDNKGEKNIFAYIVSKEKIDIKDIKKKLKKSMPAYMLPSYIGIIEKIPLTINGKLDKKLLVELDNTYAQEFAEAKNEIESSVAEIWKEILNIDKISVEDNFFEIGGNSLSLIRVYFRINQLYPDIIKIVDLFSYYTIRSISQYIMETRKSSKLSINFNRLSNEYANLSEKQNRLTKLKFTFTEVVLAKYKQMINSNSVDMDSFIKAVYICLLEEISGETNIVICISEDGVKIETINVDMEKIVDIKELENSIRSRTYNKKEFDISSFKSLVKNRRIENQDDYIIPLIIEKGVDVTDFEDYFDIILSYVYIGETLELEFVFSEKIAGEKYSEIIKSFGGLFTGAIDEYNG